MTPGAMATYAYDQLDQARAQLNAVSIKTAENRIDIIEGVATALTSMAFFEV